jgi:HSP20 family protein
MAMGQEAQQTVPLQIHQTDKLFVLAAPMPGVEPQDISVMVKGDKVTLRASYRGSRSQESGDLVMSEWTVGPYFREVTLPQPVSGPLTNATYGNGVLVLAMPKIEASHDSYTEFQLEVVEATRGQRIGHTGSDVQPTTTEEHRQKVEQSTTSTEQR